MVDNIVDHKSKWTHFKLKALIYLTIWWIFDGRKNISEGCHVPVLRRKIVNIETLAVEGGIGHVGARQPVRLKMKYFSSVNIFLAHQTITAIIGWINTGKCQKR